MKLYPDFYFRKGLECIIEMLDDLSFFFAAGCLGFIIVSELRRAIEHRIIVFKISNVKQDR